MRENGSPTPFDLALQASDPEDDVLTWSISDPAENGIAHTEGSGYSKDISYVPDTDFTGMDTFEVQVSDGELTDHIRIYVCVGRQNEPPRLTSTATLYANPGAPYSYWIEVEDPDIDDMLIITAPDIPDWLTLTDYGDGNAVLKGTPTEAGEYNLQLEVRDFYGETDEQHFTINVEPFAILSGTVTNPEDTPVENMDVEIRSDSNGFYGEGSTDSSGNYEITGIPKADDYRLTTSSYKSLYGNFGEKDFPVTGDTTKNITLMYQEDLTISGYIYETDGETPIDEVWIMAYSDTHKFSNGSLSGPDGFYEIKGLPCASDYIMTALKFGYGEEETRYHASGASVDFRLWPGGAIYGHVKDENGTAMEDVVLSFRSQIAGASVSTSTTRTGYYCRNWLPGLTPDGPATDYEIVVFIGLNEVQRAYGHQVGDKVNFTIGVPPEDRATDPAAVPGAEPPPDADLNCDSAVDLADAVIALRIQAGIPTPFCFSDADADGKIGLGDVILILRYISEAR